MKLQTGLLVLAFTVTATLQSSTFHEVEREFKDDKVSNNSTVHEEVSCKCNWHLLSHYEVKNCKPSHVDGCGCPIAFDCSNANEIGGDKVCHYKGKDYPVGATIDTTNSCEICHCSRNPEVHIVCRSSQCPIAKRPLEPNCYHVYASDLCCPQAIVCIRNEENENRQGATCEYNGQLYPFGAKIHSKDNPCETCLCTANWNGMKNSSHCYYEECVMEKHKAKLLDGCVPVYKENTCCANEFFCAPDEMTPPANKTIDLNDKGNNCILGEKMHPLGQTLLINHDTNCIQCICQTPPDFTCIEQNCPSNPNEEFCLPYYTAENCCPQYECNYRNVSPSNSSGENEKEVDTETVDVMGLENPCNDIECRAGKGCMLHRANCENDSCPLVPICTNFNQDCPTPQCAPDCFISVHANGCPTCTCKGQVLQKRDSPLKCKTPHCDGQNCHLEKKADGCYRCLCEGPCSTDCPQGCNVLTVVEGKCPQCVCEDETVGCPTPICAHKDCRIEKSKNGCPTCICDTAVREVEDETFHRKTNKYHQQQQQQQMTNDETQHYSRSMDEHMNDDYDSLIVMGRTQPRNVFRHISQERIYDP